MDATPKYWLLPNASSQEYGLQSDFLIFWIHVFMFALFIGWGLYFLYCLWRFRSRPGHKAEYTPIKASWSKYLEVGVVIIEGFLLIGVSVPFWNEFKKNFPEKDKSVSVRVIGMQFAWTFHYPGPDGEFADTAPQYFDAAGNVCAINDDDPKGYDDFCIESMTLPKDVPVIAEISSIDVIHSFAVPQLRVKQDAIPGSKVPVWFVPAKIGKYELVCSQLCGQGHYKMKADVNVVSKDDYDKWVDQQVADRRDFLGLDEPSEGTPAVVASPTPAEEDDTPEEHEDEGSHE